MNGAGSNTLSPTLSHQGRGGNTRTLSPRGIGLGRGGFSVWLSLFTSSGTLVCCALPAFLVALGAGAALSSLVAYVPGMVLLSEYKEWVFGSAAVMLAVSGYWQWQARFAPCPIDPALQGACLKTRRISAWVYGASVAIFAVGGFFAFVLPHWL